MNVDFKMNKSEGAASKVYFCLLITNGRTSTNQNTLYPHISYIIMGQKCAALFFIRLDKEGEERVKVQGREEDWKDLISPVEHANER